MLQPQSLLIKYIYQNSFIEKAAAVAVDVAVVSTGNGSRKLSAIATHAHMHIYTHTCCAQCDSARALKYAVTLLCAARS